MLNFVANWRRERAAVRELSGLSDRQLADLGVRREAIKDVVENAMAVARDEVSDYRFSSRANPVDQMATPWASHNRRALTA